MPADLKVMTWIQQNRGLGRDEIFSRLQAAGHPEADIADSYHAVVQQVVATPAAQVKHKEPWLAALLSFLLPGVGHMYAGAVGTGLALLVAYGFAWLLTITIIGAIVGIPMLLIVVIWALVGSFNAAQAANYTA